MNSLFLNYFFFFLSAFGCQNKEVKQTSDKETAQTNRQRKAEDMNQTAQMEDFASLKKIEVNGMTVEWAYRNNRLFFTLSAPTEGWVTLGFNAQNDIVHSNLIMCRVQNGKVEVEDHYVTGFGNHQPIEKLGGVSLVQNVTGSEKSGYTTVSFSMPIEAKDAFHYALKQGTKCWFICAFSAEDDFYHHSRMREHREITL